MRTRRSQSSGNPVSPQGHTPVLLHEVLQYLDIQVDDTVVDATLGGAGHARAMAEKLGEAGTIVGFDLDEAAIVRAKKALAGAKGRHIFIQANFRRMAEQLREAGVKEATKILFDLGWSSYQLDSGRGFSFLKDEPLLMTYGSDISALNARTIVNEWAEESLADIIYGWGQERYARRIARTIVEHRAKKPIETARELAEIVRSAVPPVYRRGKIHPATRTFQALRIAVNDELGALTEALQSAWEVLAPGGRLAVITFHSLEDGLVKRAFMELEKRGEGSRLTKKPISPTDEEVGANPRARSAKLRAMEKARF